MKRFITAILASVLLVFGVACNKDVVEDMKTYILSDSIFDMQVEVAGAQVYIQTGEEFYVESNLKNLTVDDEDGCLTVVSTESDKSGKGKIYIYIPDVTLGSVHMQTGAGKVNISYLSALNLYLTLGAGDTQIGALYIEDNAEIIAGAGKINIAGGAVHNLDMTLGVGECVFTSELTGDSSIAGGMGALQLNLSGLKTRYCVELQAGMGGASVDGKSVQGNTVIGSGDNFVDINGGMGKVTLNFIGELQQEEE